MDFFNILLEAKGKKPSDEEKGQSPEEEDTDYTDETVKNDPENETDYTDDVPSDEEDEQNSNEDEDTDYTSEDGEASPDEEDDGSQDDENSDPNEDTDYTDETQADDAAGGDETTEDAEATPDDTSGDMIKNRGLIEDFISFYDLIKDSMSKLSSMDKSNIFINKIISQVLQNLSSLEVKTYQYIYLVFPASNYTSNLLMYNQLLQAFKINMEMVKKINNFNPITKTNI